jgi:hypothetical protein
MFMIRSVKHFRRKAPGFAKLRRFDSIKEASSDVTRVIRQINKCCPSTGIRDSLRHWEAVIRQVQAVS